jgi:glyoxylase-like metal-dependent hydrolase (beta-lactamase superfamily II)/rhodanese-related sulfurtransferase
MIGDEETGTAAVVDPQRDTDQYIAFAAEHALNIKHVFLTHLHADFVAGHLELRDRVGAKIYLGAAAKAGYAFTPLRDGSILEFGRVRLKILETPGHTPESISILVFDLNKSATQPQAVLTGDTLFIGDVGRPDLRAALGWSATDLGGMLFDSLHTKLLGLPDESLVYPAHGAGSLCGKSLSKETVSTLGEQRRTNYALQPMSKEAFISVVTADQPDAPAYFTYDAVLNSQERPTLDETLAHVNAMTLDDVLALQAVGAQILDTREASEFGSAHLAGSINIGLGGQFATWAGTVLDREHPIVIIADPLRENEAATRLGRIGFDHVAGYLHDGLFSLHSRPDLTATTERLSAPFAAELLASAAAGHRCSQPARARSEAHRRKFGHAAQSSDGKSGKAAERSPAAGLLRRRIPFVHRRQLAAEPRLFPRQRNRRRHSRLGIRKPAGPDQPPNFISALKCAVVAPTHVSDKTPIREVPKPPNTTAVRNASQPYFFTRPLPPSLTDFVRNRYLSLS